MKDTVKILNGIIDIINEDKLQNETTLQDKWGGDLDLDNPYWGNLVNIFEHQQIPNIDDDATAEEVMNCFHALIGYFGEAQFGYIFLRLGEIQQDCVNNLTMEEFAKYGEAICYTKLWGELATILNSIEHHDVGSLSMMSMVTEEIFNLYKGFILE